VGWLRDRRSGSERETDEQASYTPQVRRPAPGIAALFDGVTEDRTHAVLDVGGAGGAHFRLYSRFARQVRFAELVPTPPHGSDWSAALRRLAPGGQRLYDLVLLWNLLDRIWPEERPAFMEELDRVTLPGARLYAVVDTSGRQTAPPLRFTLLDVDRVLEEETGPPEPTHAPLLPAEVERVLAPFEVMRAITLRSGMREYVAIKRGSETPTP
jgi:hypothetical protein